MKIFQFISTSISKVRKSNFLLAGSIVVVSTGFKVLSIFAITKYLSVKFGPEILGLYGQSQSFINLVITFSTLSSAIGITKYLSEYKNKPIIRTKIAIAAWDLTTFCSFLISFLIIIFSKYISKTIFFSENLYVYVVIIGFSTFFVAAYKTRISILNGYYEFKKIAFWEIVYNITVSLLLIGLSLILRDTVIISIGLSYILLFYFMNKKVRLNPFKLLERLSYLKSVLKPLSRYSFLIFVQTAIGFGFEIILRLYLVKKLSLSDLGLYEGMNKISGAVLLPISSIISIYFLPIFANRESGKFNSVLFDSFKKILPSLFILLCAVYLFRSSIIRIVLSLDFINLSQYIYIQLIGLFLSVINLLYLNALLGRGFIKEVFFLTISFSIILLLMFFLLINLYGLKGAFFSYLTTSLIGTLTYISFNLIKKHKLNSI